VKIAGAAGAFPTNRYHQSVITDASRAHWGDKVQRPETLSRLHSRAAVEFRNFAFPLTGYERFPSWGQSNAAWIKIADELGATAIDAALERSGLSRHDLDSLFVVSITGVASPSLDARLINRMALRPMIKRTPISSLNALVARSG